MMALIGITSPPYLDMISGDGSIGYVEKRLKEGKIKSECIKKRLTNFVKSKNDISTAGMIKSSYGKTVGQIGALGGELGVSEEHIEAGCNGVWHGCYEDGKYRKYFTKESLLHPARISPILVLKILNHLSQQDMLKQKDVVIDPFSGTGRIPLIAAMRGYGSIGVELEQYFFDMSLRNLKHLEKKLGRKLNCLLYKGDSRDIEAAIEMKESRILPKEKEDYSSAMKKVYLSAFELNINPLVAITKNKTWSNKLERLDILTKSICESVGYELYDRHKALLFEEQNQMTLDGARKRVAHGRLSMFKRMQFNKGMEVARFEDVLFFKK